MITRFDTNQRMSQAVSAGGLVFLAGQVASDTTADAAGQTRQILTKIDELLEKAGSGREMMLSANIWLANMADFAAMNAEWDAWIPKGHAPARATVQSAMASPNYKVEIAVIALASRE
ncbi:MAG: RidA family protein [Sphingomonadales bacterium]